jgi:antitoxin CcdA
MTSVQVSSEVRGLRRGENKEDRREYGVHGDLESYCKTKGFYSVPFVIFVAEFLFFVHRPSKPCRPARRQGWGCDSRNYAYIECVFKREIFMRPGPFADTPKRPVNLSLSSDLVQQGKDLGINISQVAEEALGYAVSARQAELWLWENEKAFVSYNKRVEAQGVFSDGLRTF